jgi:hypothetical protein
MQLRPLQISTPSSFSFLLLLVATMLSQDCRSTKSSTGWNKPADIRVEAVVRARR